MSHRHFCDYEGHYWECEGTAVHQFAENSERTPCICIKHSVSMDDGDHSECPVELIPCPEHCEQQLRQMSEFSTSEEAASASTRIIESLQDKIHAAASTEAEKQQAFGDLVRFLFAGEASKQTP
jgi:hypothetical protein